MANSRLKYHLRHRETITGMVSVALESIAFDQGNFMQSDFDFAPGTKFVVYNGGKYGPDPKKAAQVRFPTTFLDEAMRNAIDVVYGRRAGGVKVIPGSVWIEEITPEGHGITLWSVK